MKHTPPLKPQTAVHAKKIDNDMRPLIFSRGLRVGLIGLVAFFVLTGTLTHGQEGHDALSIDKDGNVTVRENLEVKADISVIGRVSAKKFEGDGTALTVGGVELVKQVEDNLPLTLEEAVRAVIADMVPIGTIMAYGGDVTNQKIREKLQAQGWLACDGKPVEIAGYLELYEAIGHAFGGDETHFNLPDMRGRFLRGVDYLREAEARSPNDQVRDPDRDTRTASAPGGNSGNQVGSMQNDSFQGHKHETTAINAAHSKDAIAGINRNTPDRKAAEVGKAITDSHYGEARVSEETRPKNIYVNWIMKAKHIIQTQQ